MDKKDKKARVDTDNKDKKDKKHKKARVEGATDVGGAAGEASDPSVETTGRKWTLSVGLPGTLLDAPSSVEFAVATAGQIHRAAANFQVRAAAAGGLANGCGTLSGCAAGGRLCPAPLLDRPLPNLAHLL